MYASIAFTIYLYILMSHKVLLNNVQIWSCKNFRVFLTFTLFISLRLLLFDVLPTVNERRKWKRIFFLRNEKKLKPSHQKNRSQLCLAEKEVLGRKNLAQFPSFLLLLFGKCLTPFPDPSYKRKKAKKQHNQRENSPPFSFSFPQSSCPFSHPVFPHHHLRCVT